jgi:hypothetical protein
MDKIMRQREEFLVLNGSGKDSSEEEKTMDAEMNEETRMSTKDRGFS